MKKLTTALLCAFAVTAPYPAHAVKKLITHTEESNHSRKTKSSRTHVSPCHHEAEPLIDTVMTDAIDLNETILTEAMRPVPLDINKLPRNIITDSMRFLTRDEFRNARHVNKKFYNASKPLVKHVNMRIHNDAVLVSLLDFMAATPASYAGDMTLRFKLTRAVNEEYLNSALTICKGFKEITIESPGRQRSLEYFPLDTLENLETLTLKKLTLPSQMFESLSPALKRISLTDISFHHVSYGLIFSGAPDLEELCLSSDHLNMDRNDTLRMKHIRRDFSQLQRLRRLQLSDGLFQWTDSALPNCMDNLLELNINFNSVDYVNTWDSQREEVRQIGLNDILKQFINLRKLSAVGCGLDDGRVLMIQPHENLQHLQVHVNEIGDMGLGDICRYLTKLRELTIHGNKLTSAGYTHLENLHELETLSVSQTDDHNNGYVEGLADILSRSAPSLKNLTIVTAPGGNHIHADFEAVKCFSALPLLQNLRITGAKFTDQQLEELQSELPGVKLDFS